MLSPRLACTPICALALVLAFPLVAQERETALEIHVENLSRPDPAADAQALPGDTLRYRLSFANPTAGEVHGVTLTDPVPEGMRYLEGSAMAATAAEITFSIDGGESYDLRPRIEIDGEEAGAPPSLYTHIQWRVLEPVPAAGRFEAHFDVVVGEAASD